MWNYLTISGVIGNIILALLIIALAWSWFIWPAVEAVSITRYEVAICKYRGVKNITFRQFYRSVTQEYLNLIFGRDFSQLRSRFGYWRGVGQWKVGEEIDDEV